MHFTVTTRDLAYRNDATAGWTTPAGPYQILLGDSSRNLPLSGALAVTTTVSAATQSASGPVSDANPHRMSSLVPAAIKVGNGGVDEFAALPVLSSDARHR